MDSVLCSVGPSAAVPHRQSMPSKHCSMGEVSAHPPALKHRIEAGLLSLHRGSQDSHLLLEICKIRQIVQLGGSLQDVPAFSLSHPCLEACETMAAAQCR